MTNTQPISKELKETIEKTLGKECKGCKTTNDFMIVFTDSAYCGRCIRRNHRKAMKR